MTDSFEPEIASRRSVEMLLNATEIVNKSSNVSEPRVINGISSGSSTPPLPKGIWKSDFAREGRSDGADSTDIAATDNTGTKGTTATESASDTSTGPAPAPTTTTTKPPSPPTSTTPPITNKPRSRASTSPTTITPPSPPNGAVEVNPNPDSKPSTTSSSSPSPGAAKHACPYCPQTYTRNHNLKSHLLTHSYERPFTCETCSSKFRRLHDLKRHLKLHTGEKPFICEKCGRRFARGDALIRHVKSSGQCAGVRRVSFLEEMKSGPSANTSGSNHQGAAGQQLSGGANQQQQLPQQLPQQQQQQQQQQQPQQQQSLHQSQHQPPTSQPLAPAPPLQRHSSLSSLQSDTSRASIPVAASTDSNSRPNKVLIMSNDNNSGNRNSIHNQIPPTDRNNPPFPVATSSHALFHARPTLIGPRFEPAFSYPPHPSTLPPPHKPLMVDTLSLPPISVHRPYYSPVEQHIRDDRREIDSRENLDRTSPNGQEQRGRVQGQSQGQQTQAQAVSQAQAQARVQGQGQTQPQPQSQSQSQPQSRSLSQSEPQSRSLSQSEPQSRSQSQSQPQSQPPQSQSQSQPQPEPQPQPQRQSQSQPQAQSQSQSQPEDANTASLLRVIKLLEARVRILEERLHVTEGRISFVESQR